MYVLCLQPIATCRLLCPLPLSCPKGLCVTGSRGLTAEVASTLLGWKAVSKFSEYKEHAWWGYFCGLVTVLCLKRNKASGVHIPWWHGPACHTEQPQLPLQHHQLCQSLLPYGLETVRKASPLPFTAGNAEEHFLGLCSSKWPGARLRTLCGAVLASSLEGLWARVGGNETYPQLAPWSPSPGTSPEHSWCLLQCHVQQHPLVNLSTEVV